MVIKAIAIIALLATGGCASTMGYVFDPAIDSDQLDEPGEDNKLKALKGDRRLIRTHRAGSPIYEVCAETQADAIGARSGESALKITGQGEVNDKLTEVLTATFQRTETADAVRQLHWHSCNALMNRFITLSQYQTELKAIRAGAFSTLQAKYKTVVVEGANKNQTAVTPAK